MSDGESHFGIDTDPEAEARAAAAHGEIEDPVPPETAGRNAPEGIAPARRNGGPRRQDPDAPAPDCLTEHGLEAIERLAGQAGLDPLPPGRYLDREESWLRF